MSSNIQRVDIPTKGSKLQAFRAFRRWAEKVASERGETLDPEWYKDSPEDAPELYEDQKTE